jgi:hypothetical protein
MPSQKFKVGEMVGGAVHLLKIREGGSWNFQGGPRGYGLDGRNREGGLKTARGGHEGGARPHFLASRSTFCDPHHSYLSGMPIASAQWFAVCSKNRGLPCAISSSVLQSLSQ